MTHSAPDSTHILLIEDDLITREDVAHMLRKDYPGLLLARNGHEGLELFRRYQPRVILSDVRMPVMDGLELAREIKSATKDGPPVHIILASGATDEDLLIQAIDCGVDKFIRKPIERTELLAAVEAALGRILRETERASLFALYEKVHEHSPDFLLTTDGEQIFFMNKPFMGFLGREARKRDSMELMAEVLRIDPEQRTHATDCATTHVVQQLLDCPDGECVVHIRAPHTAKRSDTRTFLCHVGKLPDGAHPSHILTFTDITRLHAERQLYQQLAMRDPLTGIANRQKLFDELEREIARAERYTHPLSLIMLDLDDFKTVNDRFGHQTGDEVLIELADIISGHIRSADLFARYGGEEFFILVPETDGAGGADLAEKIRTIVAEKTFSCNTPLTVSLSVATRQPGETPDALISRADKGLYAAKRAGKNCVVKA